jgi:hypothetical protein
MLKMSFLEVDDGEAMPELIPASLKLIATEPDLALCEDQMKQ